MKVQFDFMLYFYEYILTLINTHEDSLKLNDEYLKVIEGDCTNYQNVLELSFKMNKNIVDIMKAREVLLKSDDMYTQYTN